MYGKIKEHLTAELEEINSAGLFKAERIIAGPQGTEVKLTTGEEPIIFCANNTFLLNNPTPSYRWQHRCKKYK